MIEENCYNDPIIGEKVWNNTTSNEHGVTLQNSYKYINFSAKNSYSYLVF